MVIVPQPSGSQRATSPAPRSFTLSHSAAKAANQRVSTPVKAPFIPRTPVASTQTPQVRQNALVTNSYNNRAAQPKTLVSQTAVSSDDHPFVPGKITVGRLFGLFVSGVVGAGLAAIGTSSLFGGFQNKLAPARFALVGVGFVAGVSAVYVNYSNGDYKNPQSKPKSFFDFNTKPSDYN